MTGITLNESLVCPDFSGDRSCVTSSEASGPSCCRTNQNFLGLAVYYVFVFRGHTQVSDPLTGIRRLVYLGAIKILGKRNPRIPLSQPGQMVLAVSGMFKPR